MNKKFKECLTEVYLGEQAGEMIFESLLTTAENDNQRYIYSNMLQLETEGKAIMRPLLVKLGLPIEDISPVKDYYIKKRGDYWKFQIKGLDHIDMMEALQDLKYNLPNWKLATAAKVILKDEEFGKLTASTWKDWLDENQMSYNSGYSFMGYNPPYQLIGRRNEIMIDLD